VNTYNKKGSKFLVLNSDGYDRSSEEEPSRLSNMVPTYTYLKAV